MISVMIGKKAMFIRGEDKQWSVGKMTTVNKKDKQGVIIGQEEVFTGEAFYSTLEGMIRGVLEKKLRSADANSLTELQQELRVAKDELKGMYDTCLVES